MCHKKEKNREEEKRRAIRQIRLWHVPFVSIGNSSPHNTSFLLTVRKRSNPIPRSYPRTTIGRIYRKQMEVNRRWPTFFERWFDHAEQARKESEERKKERKEDFSSRRQDRPEWISSKNEWPTLAKKKIYRHLSACAARISRPAA